MQLQITSNASDVAARLAEIPALIETAMFDAMGRSLDESQNYAVGYMFSNFKAPTGELEGAFYQTIEAGGGGVTGSLINPSAYAWRREKGFSGMTDSIGRYFPNDPGVDYMTETLAVEEAPIFGIFTDAIGMAIGGL